MKYVQTDQHRKEIAAAVLEEQQEAFASLLQAKNDLFGPAQRDEDAASAITALDRAIPIVQHYFRLYYNTLKEVHSGN